MTTSKSSKSDLDTLLKRLNDFLVACEQARGTALTKAPLEIRLYNIATYTKRELGDFKAMIEDFNGTYMKGKYEDNQNG